MRCARATHHCGVFGKFSRSPRCDETHLATEPRSKHGTRHIRNPAHGSLVDRARDRLPNHAAIHCVRRECNPCECAHRTRRTICRMLRHSHMNVEMTNVTTVVIFARTIRRSSCVISMAPPAPASSLASLVMIEHAITSAAPPLLERSRAKRPSGEAVLCEQCWARCRRRVPSVQGNDIARAPRNQAIARLDNRNRSGCRYRAHRRFCSR